MIKISVLSVEKSTPPGKKYVIAEVSFKNLTFGKVESKKIFSFGAQEQAFKALADAVTGEVYEVEVAKNDKGYNDWVKVTSVAPGGETTPAPGQTANAYASPVRSGGNWETPEERAKKQVYIIKQSSLAQAVATLSVGAKAVKKEEVVDLAQYYTDFVFAEKATSLFDMPSDDLDDVPH